MDGSSFDFGSRAEWKCVGGIRDFEMDTVLDLATHGPH